MEAVSHIRYQSDIVNSCTYSGIIDGDYGSYAPVPIPDVPPPAGGYGSYGSYSNVDVPASVSVAQPVPAPAGGYGSYGSYPEPAGGYASYGTYKRMLGDFVKRFWS